MRNKLALVLARFGGKLKSKSFPITFVCVCIKSYFPDVNDFKIVSATTTSSKINTNHIYLLTPSLLLAWQRENSKMCCIGFYFLNVTVISATWKWIPVLTIKHTSGNSTHSIPNQHFNCEIHSILQYILIYCLYYSLFFDVCPSSSSPLQLTKVTAGQPPQLSFPNCFEMRAIERKLTLLTVSFLLPGKPHKLRWIYGIYFLKGTQL